MRVLHVHSGNLYGGIETYLLTLATYGNESSKMESEFALCFAGCLSEELLAHGARVHLLGKVHVRYPWEVVRARSALADLLQRGSYDMILCHSAWSQAIFGPVARRAKIKVPQILYLHGPAGKQHWLDRWASRVRPDHVICNSNHTQTGLSAMYPGVGSDVVYLPVPPPKEFTLEDRAAVRAELQTGTDDVVIIQVSRIEPGKGHILHLQALAQLPESAKWTAWIVGGVQRPAEARYFEDVKKKAADLGVMDRLRFTGQRADVARLLAAADIFCQPNIGPESFGISFVEALYAGLPVVTSDIGGAREIVDESCGLRLPPGDITVLKSALIRLVGSPGLRRSLGEAGRVRARQVTEPRMQISKLYGVLHGIVTQRQTTSVNRSEHAPIPENKSV